MKIALAFGLLLTTNGQPQAMPKAFVFEEENDLITFHYGWSAEAAVVPQLVQRFRKEMEKVKAELVTGAKEYKAEHEKDGFGSNPYEAQRSYETEGKSSRLLSLQMTAYAFTGGAHPNSWTGALLWDRRLGRETSISQLLHPGTSWTGAIRQPFCVLLDREREERRGEPVSKGDDPFDDCPNYDKLTVLLVDTDHNGRFDHVNVIADSYVAGPYVEGEYEILLPITATMISRLKPEFSSSFEPQPPIQ